MQLCSFLYIYKQQCFTHLPLYKLVILLKHNVIYNCFSKCW